VRQSIPTAWLSLTVREGNNRQVCRRTAALGFPTLRLIRAAIGPYRLGTLPPGQWQSLNLTATNVPEPLTLPRGSKPGWLSKR
jgi:23S rRNA pseudouridine2457 synthase